MDNSNGMNTGDSQTPADPARRIKDSASTVKDSASSVIERGKEAATRSVEEGAQRLAGSAESTASALRRAAEDLESDNAWIGAALRKGADGLEQATRTLSNGDLSRVVDDVNGFARRQPTLFLGACFALGFALARVGKTAIEQQGGEQRSDDTYSPMPGL